MTTITSKATALEFSLGDLPPQPDPSLLVSRLLDHASDIGASDLFFSCEESHWAIAVRRLGLVQQVATLTPEVGLHCAAHLRAEAGIDIAEHRRPQAGRWIHKTPAGKTLDLRVSTMPTLYGLDVSVRLLDRQTCLLQLDRIGLLPTDAERLERLLDSPGGLILVSGPTGSGKTTTLYACLQYLNNGLRRIHTIEDPIEYAIPGLRQSQVNAKSGIHFPDLLRGIIRQGPDVIMIGEIFPDLLRGIIRQGPDVIMIGEIRDPETAQTAVYAANSGHLVLATIHSSLAAGSVASMLAFGVAPQFLASAMIGAISQRLVRTFCPECRFPISLEVDDPIPEPQPEESQFAAIGCPACYHTGFAGRTAVFEILEVTPSIRKLIQAQEPAQAIDEQGHRDGMQGLFQSSRALISRGWTDHDEIERHIPSAGLQPPDSVER